MKKGDMVFILYDPHHRRPAAPVTLGKVGAILGDGLMSVECGTGGRLPYAVGNLEIATPHKLRRRGEDLLARGRHFIQMAKKIEEEEKERGEKN